MTFALIGDYQYREVMEMNVSQIEKFHPYAEIVIGDLGGNDDWGHRVIDLSGQTEREAYMMMKPLLLSFLGSKKVILMDGDTVLIKPFDIDLQIELGTTAIVTTRKSRHGRINSGVIYCNCQSFTTDWLKNGIKRLAGADLSKEQLCEQNALIDTVDSYTPTVKEVPCDIYNYSKVESGIPDEVRIVHLKSGRFRKPELVERVKERIND